MDEIHNCNRQRRPHLTKEQRLPQCFKEVEKVIRTVKSCKGNYKTILANSRLRGRVLSKVYSMTVNVLKHYNYVQRIIDKIHLLEKEKYLRREIASILIYELIFGSGTLPGESKVVTTIQAHENDIRYAHEVLRNNKDDFITKEINIPRYVRVHTLVTTVPYVIKDLENYGYKQIFYDENLPDEKYLELVRSLEKGCFLVDFHFKDVLVFEHSENLIYLDLYKNGHIFLQDKASYIPVHVLNPQPSCTVLDACAAPGVKTLHIASSMKNKGILIACERDKARFESLKKMLEYGSVKICRSLCKDFKLLDPNDQAYSTVEYILLDPSCSGSGMVNRMDEVTDTEDSKNKERLMKLAGFQIILLKHALKFPSVKRVVYSTCSIHEEENEYVVHEVLNAYNSAFELVPVMPEWSQRGSENYEFGKLCLRTVPEKHLTNGFFVAMFERVKCDLYSNEEHFSKNYDQQDIHAADSKTSPCDSGNKKHRKKSAGKNEMNDVTGNILDDDCHKDQQKFDYDPKKKKGKYSDECLYESNKKGRTYMIDEKMSSNNIQEKYKEGKKEKYSGEYPYENKRDRTDMNDEQEQIGSGFVPGKKKKHKKNKKEQTSSDYLSGSIISGKTNIIDEQEPVCSDFVPEKKKKHKKNKKEQNSGECLSEPIITDRTAIIDEQGQMNLDYTENKKKKHKKKEIKTGECLYKCNKVTEEMPNMLLEPHSVENVPKNIEIMETSANGSSSSRKKKKHHKIRDINFLETQTVPPKNNMGSYTSKKDMETSHFISPNNMQLENSFQNECKDSSEILPVKDKKHKKHSKNSKPYSDDFNNKDKHSDKSTISCNETDNLNCELISGIQYDSVTVNETIKHERKKKKHEKTDDSLNCISNVNNILSAELLEASEKGVHNNEILSKQVTSNEDYYVKKKKSKKHKKNIREV